jgi:3-oxoacyl-(acyl-carrier-protein) synthase
MKNQRRLKMFNIFKKKKEERELPYHYLQIVWTDNAVHDATFDDYNKEIQRIRGGVIVEQCSYTLADLKAFKEVYKIPVRDTTIERDESFQFETMDAMTGSFSEVRQ